MNIGLPKNKEGFFVLDDNQKQTEREKYLNNTSIEDIEKKIMELENILLSQ